MRGMTEKEYWSYILSGNVSTGDVVKCNENVRGKQRVIHTAELQAGERTAGLQHAIGFFQYRWYRRAIPNSERDGV